MSSRDDNNLLDDINVSSIKTAIVFVSYEGETFVTRDELKKVRTMRQFARRNRITAFLFIKTETQISKREKPRTAVDTKTEKPGVF